MSRLLGIQFFGYGLLAWLVRNTEDSQVQQTILTVFLITDSMGFASALIAQVLGDMNVFGWSNVVIFLALAVVFGYLLVQSE